MSDKKAARILADLAAEITGSYLFNADDDQHVGLINWLEGRIRDETGVGTGIYLAGIYDIQKGRIRDGSRAGAEVIFNRILLSYPAPLRDDDVISGLNRYPAECAYFEQEILPLLLEEKIRKGEKILKIRVPGSSTGEEMATLYYYVKRGIEAYGKINLKCGTIDEWAIEIYGMDILAPLVSKGETNLIDSPGAFKTLFSHGLGTGIVNAISALSKPMRQKIFKIMHGNLAYKKDRDDFLKDADVVFVNTTLPYVNYPVRGEVIRDLLGRSIWICTNSRSVYEESDKERVVTEIVDWNGSYRYIVAPPGTTSIPMGKTESYDTTYLKLAVVDVLDSSGACLSTSADRKLGGYPVDYKRSRHVKAIVKAIKQRRLRLPPHVISGLTQLAKYQHPEGRHAWVNRVAGRILEVCGNYYADSKDPQISRYFTDIRPKPVERSDERAMEMSVLRPAALGERVTYEAAKAALVAGDYGRAVEIYEELSAGRIPDELKPKIIGDLKTLRERNLVERHYFTRIESLIEELQGIDLAARGIDSLNKLWDACRSDLECASALTATTEKEYWVRVYYSLRAVGEYGEKVGKLNGGEQGGTWGIAGKILGEVIKACESRGFNKQLLTFGLEGEFLDPSRDSIQVFGRLREFRNKKVSLLRMRSPEAAFLRGQIVRMQELARMARYAELPVINPNMSFADMRGAVMIADFRTASEDTIEMLNCSLRTEGVSLILANPTTSLLIADTEAGTLSIVTGYVYDKNGVLTLAQFAEPPAIDFILQQPFSFPADQISLARFRIPWALPPGARWVADNKATTKNVLRGLMPESITVSRDNWRQSPDTARDKTVDAIQETFPGDVDVVCKTAKGSGGMGMDTANTGDMDGVISLVDKFIDLSPELLIEKRLFPPRIMFGREKLYWNVRAFLVLEPSGNYKMIGTMIRTSKNPIVKLSAETVTLNTDWAWQHFEDPTSWGQEKKAVVQREMSEMSVVSAETCNTEGAKMFASFLRDYLDFVGDNYQQDAEQLVPYGAESGVQKAITLAVDFIYDEPSDRLYVGEIQGNYGGMHEASLLGIDFSEVLASAREAGIRHHKYMTEHGELIHIASPERDCLSQV